MPVGFLGALGLSVHTCCTRLTPLRAGGVPVSLIHGQGTPTSQRQGRGQSYSIARSNLSTLGKDCGLSCASQREGVSGSFLCFVFTGLF